MTTPNPLHLANTAQNMARNAPQNDAAVFHKVAMISMGVMAAASVVQMLQPVLRGLSKARSDRDQGRSR